MKNGYLNNLPTTKSGLIAPTDARFYYIRDRNNQPRITVCLGNDDGTPVRGIAICSLEDTIDKGTGRKLAYVRMKQAIQHQGSQDIILGAKAHKVATSYLTGITHKSEYDANLTDFEEDLVTELAL